MLVFALDGVRWWSLLILDGYSRMIVAGAVAPSEASWVALLVLYTACQRYGIPRTLISDSGGAFVATAFEAVCRRLGIAHTTIVSTAGESYLNLIETHFNIQRRVYDYQFSLTRTPMEFEQAHQRFIHLYNTTAHQGLLKEHFTPPIPQAVLGDALGQRVTPDELQRKFAQALFLRTTNHYGCVTLHRSHFYVEAGLPTTPVLLWVDGEAVRAVYDNVVVAEYHCRYDRRVQKVVNIHTGYFHHTRFASSQEMLLPRSAAERVILLPPHRPMHQACPPYPAQQLGLFEWTNTA
jgi:hypothetical protein